MAVIKALRPQVLIQDTPSGPQPTQPQVDTQPTVQGPPTKAPPTVFGVPVPKVTPAISSQTTDTPAGQPALLTVLPTGQSVFTVSAGTHDVEGSKVSTPTSTSTMSTRFLVPEETTGTGMDTRPQRWSRSDKTTTKMPKEVTSAPSTPTPITPSPITPPRIGQPPIEEMTQEELEKYMIDLQQKIDTMTTDEVQDELYDAVIQRLKTRLTQAREFYTAHFADRDETY